MDDILDLDWVLSHETEIEEKEATLFQQCTSTDMLLIGTAMLFDNSIPFKIKLPKTEEPTHFGPIQEIHIPEKYFEKAHELLEKLLNNDPSYPKRLSSYYSDERLKLMLEDGENPYQEELIKIEMKSRGIEIKESSNSGKSLLIVLFIIIVFFFLEWIRS